MSHNPCYYYLKAHDCEKFVLCVLKQKGYRILEYDVHGYDILARYPGGLYDYYIEVKCGPSARLSEYQRAFKDAVENVAPEVGYNARYVVCRFDFIKDDRGEEKAILIEDDMCKRLLSGYI